MLIPIKAANHYEKIAPTVTDDAARVASLAGRFVFVIGERRPYRSSRISRMSCRAAASSGSSPHSSRMSRSARPQTANPPYPDKRFAVTEPERAQDARVASVAARKGEVFKELGHAVTEHRSIVAAGLVAER